MDAHLGMLPPGFEEELRRVARGNEHATASMLENLARADMPEVRTLVPECVYSRT